MNYNEFSSSALIILNDKPNTRAKLDTGTHCNYRCSFCYYQNKLDEITGFDSIKERARRLFDFGMDEIDLSGGESSIHRNWFDILDYCKKLGFKNISSLTNGSKFADKDFLRKSQEHGLNELLFSLHGWDEASHVQVVRTKGSFERIIQAIHNSKEMGIKVRLNCTVTGLNAPHLIKYANLVNRLDPLQLNFLPLNFWDDAEKILAEKYEILSEGIKGAIDNLNPRIEINVRYIPYCFMKGYEKYVVGIYQHIFDPGDWNIIAYDVNKLPSKKPDVSDYFLHAKKQRIYSYTKKSECYRCRYFNICDGIEHKLKMSQDVYPFEGEKLNDVLYFRRGYYPSC